MQAYITRIFVLLGAWTFSSAGCVPSTDLWAEAGKEQDPASEDESVALASPAPGEIDVPPNLAMLVLRLPPMVDETSLNAASVSLRATGPEVLTRSLGVGACAESNGHCWSLAVTSALVGSTTYAPTLSAPLTLSNGTKLATSKVGAFTTAAAPDDLPPMVVLQSVELAGPCLRVAFAVSELSATSVVLGTAAGDREEPPLVTWSTGDGTGNLEAWVPFGAIGGPVAVQARARDRAGNAAASPATLVTLPSLPAVSISEILSNPAGTEPTQEFVELHNSGDVPVDLTGYVLEDGKGRDLLPAGSLAAGGFALVVAAGFEESAPGDVPPRAGTLLLRVDSRLGGDGLANDRDVVRLRSPDGTLLSSYDGFTSTSAASWNGRSLHRRLGSVCDGPASWSTLPAAPTPGWE